ncbi:MAG: Hsp70 family protein [Lachnospiraceae bacterium]|nr:Hsp70 family protein [Lachnospiraceae bacterium]
MVLGIDLGTTYSVGAFIDSKGELRIIENSEGSTLTPSVVLFDNEKNIVVGEIAKENAVIRPEDVVAVVKNYMGKKVALKTYNGQEYTPEMVSSFIIKKIVVDAEKYIGEKIEDVVITVPAYFTDAQRKATEDAATIAGVRLLGMINEPTAAALCYARKHDIKCETIMVYDLGGGTFDVTVLDIDEMGNAVVRCTGGLSNTGGRFFDQSIVDYVVKYFDDEYDIDLEDDEYESELQELYIKAENIKQQLSKRNSADIPIKVDKIKESISITRDQFCEMIKKTYLRTESKVKEVLRSSNVSIDQIDKVILIGGSTRIPYVYSEIAGLLNKEPICNINPDEAVAMGAAIYGNYIKDDKTNKKIIDVCSHSIGVAETDHLTQKRANYILIKKNSKLPIEVEEKGFRTITDNQRQIDLTITEGEYAELSDVTIIGDFPVCLPPNIPGGTQVVIKIGLDQYQLMYVRISLPDIGYEEEYKISRLANMSEDTIKKATGIVRDCSIR